MARPPSDHDLRIYVDGDLYLALSRLADEDDRALSNYCKQVLRAHVDEVLAARAGWERGTRRTAQPE